MKIDIKQLKQIIRETVIQERRKALVESDRYPDLLGRDAGDVDVLRASYRSTEELWQDTASALLNKQWGKARSLLDDLGLRKDVPEELQSAEEYGLTGPYASIIQDRIDQVNAHARRSKRNVTEATPAQLRTKAPAMFNLWRQHLVDSVSDAGYDDVEYTPLFATSHDLRANDVIRKMYARGLSPRQAMEMLEDPRKFYDNNVR